MNSFIAFVGLLLLCIVSIVSSQTYIRLTRVDPMMQAFLPPKNQKREMGKPNIGHLRMVNHKMYSIKRGGNSDEMFRHFLDYIFQIQNDEDSEEWRRDKREMENTKDLSNEYDFKVKRAFQPYPIRFINKVNTDKPREQRFDNSLTKLQRLHYTFFVVLSNLHFHNLSRHTILFFRCYLKRYFKFLPNKL